MKRIYRLIQDYFFTFSARETNGFVILIFIGAFLLLIPTVLRLLPQTASTPEELQQDYELTQKVLAEIEQKQAENSTFEYTGEYNYKKSNYEAKTKADAKFVFEPFDFNPNKIGVTEWKKLGLKDYLAERIEKYKHKGGSFKYKSDLQKIYGFPNWLYLKLEPYIVLPEKYDIEADLVQNLENTPKYKNGKSLKNTSLYPSKKDPLSSFDLNQVDTSRLRKVRGIGVVLSQRIITFRDKLGGFHSLQQLKEVYGLKPEVCTELLKFAKLENPNFQKVKINSAPFEELKKHPYIKYKAKILINYRKQHGNYSSVEDLKKIRALDEKTIQKLEPYLSFE